MSDVLYVEEFSETDLVKLKKIRCWLSRRNLTIARKRPLNDESQMPFYRSVSPIMQPYYEGEEQLDPVEQGIGKRATSTPVASPKVNVYQGKETNKDPKLAVFPSSAENVPMHMNPIVVLRDIRNELEYLQTHPNTLI